ncbi:stage II sporulation protein M [Bacteriovorax sp. DB6_IX]|uniref:stage II sporulation protein M n=1 Tax=Bacteriovorax sp. DB6_IX TaxID=1353530 RepID=UPI0005581E88|nr:stage II sporulation protein M [Bacteriovorax sp. DB6_IX]
MRQLQKKYFQKSLKKKYQILFETLNLIDSKLNALEQKKSKSFKVENFIEIISLYESLSNELYYIRKNSPQMVSNIEDRVTHISHRIQNLTKKENSTKNIYKNMTTNYRRLWRDHGQLFLLSLFCFLISIILGWAISYQYPQYTAIFFPEHHIEDMIKGHQWFDRIKENPLLSGFKIAFNNIKVCILAYMLGMFCGIGGLYILIFNGAMVGVLIGLSYQYAFNENINGFIASHGPLELTLIVASCFASFVYGQSFFKRPYKDIKKRLGHTLRESLYILIPLTSWLAIAALFEVLVSPFDYLSDSQKLSAGLLIALAFWIWTLWPESSNSQMTLLQSEMPSEQNPST